MLCRHRSLIEVRHLVTRPQWPVVVAALLVLASIALRIVLAIRPGLWSDEIFSLAMATGHSLEHPAAAAVPRLGDFVEPRSAQSPPTFRRYAEHDRPPAGAGRVIRAVFLSDTSPPLYYVLLNWWTRGFGTGDAALRLFSVWWAVLTLPLLWLLARPLDRRGTALSVGLLFGFSPVAIYYSTEGRMYSLLWFLTSALALLSIRLSRARGPWPAALWVLVGAAGLLTHYFFAFVWLACVAWLVLRGFAGRRRRVAVLAALTLLAVLPWYRQVPASLAAWRVSAGWLRGELPWPATLARPFMLAYSLLSGRNVWGGGWRWADRAAALLYLLLAIWIVRRGLCRRMFSRRRLLLWAWLAAGCVGPVVFDLLQHSTTSSIARYALPALPAAFLLAAIAMSRLPGKIQPAFLAAILLAWLPGTWSILSNPPRRWEPYRDIDAHLAAWAGPGDLVLVHSIPSGVIGVARYLKSDVDFASWVAALHVRSMPADLQLLLAGRARVALVKVHDLGEPSPPESWLTAHARLIRRDEFPDARAEILYFEPSAGGSFFPEPSSGALWLRPNRSRWPATASGR